MYNHYKVLTVVEFAEICGMSSSWATKKLRQFRKIKKKRTLLHGDLEDIFECIALHEAIDINEHILS